MVKKLDRNKLRQKKHRSIRRKIIIHSWAGCYVFVHAV